MLYVTIQLSTHVFTMPYRLQIVSARQFGIYCKLFMQEGTTPGQMVCQISE